MDILGIGVPEFIFILLIALIVLGPKDMQKAGKTIGTWMRKVVMSEEWHTIKNASRKLKTLPNELMREASLDELSSEFEQFRKKDLEETIFKGDFGAWSGAPTPRPHSDNCIAPPVDEEPVSVQVTDTSPETTSPNTAPTESDNA